jgi:hypothetical protein
MSNNTNQPTDTAGSSYNPTRTRAIDGTTIAEIARLTAKMLTESEACRRLGINPRRWFDWKTRHNRAEKFAALLEAFRADRIDSLIAKIEASADGVGMKQPDWRAAAFLLSVTDKHRFGSQAEAAPQAASGVNTLSDESMGRILAMLRAGNAKPAASVTAGPPAALIVDAETTEQAG